MDKTDALLDRLLVLLNHDKAAVRQLVNGAIARYPNQSSTWYLERVIFEVLQERIAEKQRERAKIPIVTSTLPVEVKPLIPPPPKSVVVKTTVKPKQVEKISKKKQESTFSKADPPPIQPTWRLIKHFNGDRKAAERLLESAMAKYPDKPEQWILDKVAWDLWRDRM